MENSGALKDHRWLLASTQRQRGSHKTLWTIYRDYGTRARSSERISCRTQPRLALNPGESFDESHLKMLAGMSGALDRLSRNTSLGPKEIEILGWLKLDLTNIVTAASYGLGNRFVDPEVGKSFWNYEINFIYSLSV
jgi:hypothetical protein